MQTFEIMVKPRNKRPVITNPKTYHVPAHYQEDLLFTIHPDYEEDYDLEKIKFNGAPFSQQRVNSKTICVHDDNHLHWKKGDTVYKYEVFVKPVEGGKSLKEDPIIVNQ